jgi:hypothetical protein
MAEQLMTSEESPGSIGLVGWLIHVNNIMG